MRMIKKFVLISFLLTLIMTVSIYADDDTSLLLFETSHCLHCQEVKEILSEYSDLNEIQIVNIRTEMGSRLFKEKTTQFKAPKSVPMLIVEDTYVLIGKQAIVDWLEKPSQSTTDEGIILRAGSIALAGLIDGINPCALTMLIFLMTYLSFSSFNKGKKRILIVGMLYAITTFTVYFVIGLGLFTSLLYLRAIDYMLPTIYLITGIMALVLAWIHFRDYLNIKKDKGQPMKSQLSVAKKNKILQWIEKQLSKNKNIYITTIIIATGVSVFEFLCTGQIYLPTIAYMISFTNNSVVGIYYLLLYNFMFVLPIVVVTVMVILTQSIATASELLLNKTSHVKGLGTLFFAILASYMLWQFALIL